jgi:hypothetical protein
MIGKTGDKKNKNIPFKNSLKNCNMIKPLLKSDRIIEGIRQTLNRF